MGDYQLSQEQVAAYHRDGFLLLPAYFPREDMDLLLKVARADQALMERARDLLDAEGKVSRLSLHYSLQESIYSAYARHKAIVEPIEQLVGDEVFHYHHKMMLKEPKVGGAWEWHQDYGYWYVDFLNADMASCMIAVDRANRENGCLQVLKGSHLMGRIEHGRVGEQTGADVERVQQMCKRLETVYCEMEPGTALFFHSNLLHRSDPNESEDSRWALICCYSAASNPTFRADAKAGHYEKLERWDAEQIEVAAQKHWQEVGS